MPKKPYLCSRKIKDNITTKTQVPEGQMRLMKTYNEMAQYLTENGYKMEQAISGYYYLTRFNEEEGIDETVWMDSACEDAYDLESATAMAYEMVVNG